MARLKLMTLLGTRPEIIRLSETIKVCDRQFDQVLVHTGQNWDYTLNEIFFADLGLRAPDHYLNVVAGSLGATIGNIIASSFEVMDREKPDALLLLGDTNSCLAAIAAKRLKIPIFHMEAGNRCYDQNVPEEINRKLVDHTSDINLAYTEHSRRNLLREGLRPDHVFVTGSPMPEVLAAQAGRIEGSDVLERLGLSAGGYLVLSAHREENVDDPGRFLALTEAINVIAQTLSMPIIFSTHPRTWKRIESHGIVFDANVAQMKPFSFSDYNQLQKNAYCVLSDSGTLSEESALLHFPGVLLRTSTERPEVFDKGSVVLSELTLAALLQSIELARTIHEGAPLPPDYSDQNVSLKVTKIIQSYTAIVNREVWRKPFEG